MSDHFTYKVIVDWEKLGAKMGFTPHNFRNGYCPEMALILNRLIPDSRLCLGIGFYGHAKHATRGRLEHVVVVWTNQAGVSYSFDAEGRKAIERWKQLQREEGRSPHKTKWEEVSLSEYEGSVEEYDGSVSHFTIAQITPFVSVEKVAVPFRNKLTSLIGRAKVWA